MHDGAWFGVALARAAMVTGDRWYRDLLLRELLPLYLKMLNHSDELFDPSRNDADQPVPVTWEGRQLGPEREQGFVPDWWNNGLSVSLEMLNRRDGVRRLTLPGRDELKETGDPECRLSGHSLGMSNHMAQDLAVLLQAAWKLLADRRDPEEVALRTAIGEAARHLEAGRARRGHPNIPAVVAAYARANDDGQRRCGGGGPSAGSELGGVGPHGAPTGTMPWRRRRRGKESAFRHSRMMRCTNGSLRSFGMGR